MQEPEELAKRIAALTAEQQALLGTPAPFGDHSKSGALLVLKERIASLFAQKRAMSMARYKADF